MLRISVNHYRFLLIIGNLVLAVGITVQGGYNVLVREVTDSTHPEVTPLSEFRYVKQARATGPSGPQRVQIVADQLQPRKPPPPVPEPEKEPEVVENGADDPAIPGGPLAEEWEYVPQFIWPDSPLNNSGILRKKDSTPTRTSVRTSSRVRRRAIRSRVSRSVRSRRLRSRRNETQVSFRVKERRIQNEDHDLDVFIESADDEQLVYWLEKEPNKLYALKRAHYSDYFEREDEKRLSPPEDESEDDGSEEDDGENEGRIVVRPPDYKDRREADYQQIRAGKISPSGFKSAKVKSRTTSPPSAPTRASASRKPAQQESSGRATATRKRKMNPQEQKKAMKKLKGFLESDKIPEKERKKLREAVIGAEK